MSKHPLEQLFGSRVRVKVLRFIFRNETASFEMRHLAERVQESIADVRQELEALRGAGLLRIRR